MIGNRIVTRGMGRSLGVPGRSGMVTQGYGGLAQIIINVASEIVRKGITYGRSATRKVIEEFETIFVSAKLIEVNNSVPKKLIKGEIVVKMKRNDGIVAIANFVNSIVVETAMRVKIAIKRIFGR